MRFPNIRCDLDGSVARITIVPPDRGPTIREDTAADLIDCCAQLQLMDEIAVVTIEGGPDVFAVGRQSPPDDVLNADIAERMAWIGGMGAADAFARLPMPTVAILNGDAVAHGLELALAADLRVAVDSAGLGMGSLAEHGFPYDGGTQRLPRLVGPCLARDMLFTGRLLSAEEALVHGLVNRIAPASRLGTAAADVVQELLAAAPIASRYAKEAVSAAGDLTLAQGLRLEADLSIILHSTADRAEGLRSFMERRPPQFHGR